MKKNIKIYHTIDLAKMYDVHPNTIRLYEKLRFISHAQRKENNYRIFEELHVLQVKVCRCIFGYPFTNRSIRKAGNEIMWATAKKQWDKAKQYTDQYIEIIEQEIRKAQNAAEMLRSWAEPVKDNEILLENRMLSRKEVADYFRVTTEAVRNWERNGLIISDEAGEKGERLYFRADLGRMCVVYMLLQSGYSVASIHRSLSMHDKGKTELVTSALNNPDRDDLISVGDRWLYELNKLMKAAREIPPIIEEIKILL